MKQVILTSLLAITVIAVHLPAYAQQFQPKAIKFIGDPEYSDAELMTAAHLKPGALLTGPEMADHTKLLLDSGVFETLSYKFDGITLTFNLSPAPIIYPARFSNFPIADTPDFESLLRQKLPLYHGKVPPDGTLTDNLRALLEEQLSSQGIQASVSVMPYADPDLHQVTAMDFSILNPPVVIGDVTVEGNSATFSAPIQTIVQRLKSTPYDQYSSAQSLVQTIENYYTDQGYAAVNVQATAANHPVLSATNLKIPFTVKIREGNIYKLGSIQLAADIPVTQDEIAKVLKLHAGDTIKGVNLRSVWQLISNKYKSKGFLTCTVKPKLQLDEANETVNYTVSVTPGPVFKMGSIRFDGFSDELRGELMKNWTLMPGDLFDFMFVQNYVLKLSAKDDAARALFRGAKVSFTMNTDTATRQVNVVYKSEH